MQKDTNYLVITHNRVYGIPNALRDYLIEKKLKRVVFISHPLDNVSGDSFMQVYKRGEMINEVKIKRSPKIGFVNFFIDTFLTLYWVAFKLPKFDVCVGNNNLNAFAGLILKKTGRLKKCIYYSMDFSLDRLKNPWLNKIYHAIEKYSVKKSDEVWVVSKAIPYAREEYLGISSVDYPQKIVPTGVWFDETKIKNFSKINQNQLFFIGHLLKKQGVQKVLEAIPLISKKIKDFKFVIVGGGEYKKTLENLTKKLKIKDKVKFTGIIRSHKDVYKIMNKSAVGIATYKPEEDKTKNFTYFGDPGKIKDYLAAGLPVILTDVSHNAKNLEKNGCAIVVEYNKQEIARAVIKIMKSKTSLKKYRENAIKKAKQFDWHAIFDAAFEVRKKEKK